jgi:hypothetical protein
VQYVQRIKYIKAILGSQQKIDAWFRYFDANWNNCKDKWCACQRCDVPHLGNNTNNRLESSWHKLRGLVNRFTEMDECLVSIIFWQKSKELAWDRQVKSISVARVANADTELNRLAGVVSMYTFDLIRAQYDFAVKASTAYKMYSAYPPIVFISYIRPGDSSDDDEKEEEDDDEGVVYDDIPDEYSVDTRQWTCSCPFMMTRLLPCRHVLYLRRLKHPSAIIPISKINKRWLIAEVKKYSVSSESICLDEEDVETFATASVIASKSLKARTLAANERYNILVTVAKQIASDGSRFGTAHVRSLELSLHNYLQIVRDGKVPVCTSSERPDQSGAQTEILSQPHVRPCYESVLDHQTLSQTISVSRPHSLSNTPTLSEPDALSTLSQPDALLLTDLTNSQLGITNSPIDEIEAALDDETAATNDEATLSIGEDMRDSYDFATVMTRNGHVASDEPPDSTLPPFSISKTAPVPGRPRESKTERKKKKARATKEADNQYNLFARTGQRATILEFRNLYNRGKITFAKARDLLDAMREVHSYSQPRINLLAHKTPTPEDELTTVFDMSTVKRMEEAMRTYIRRSKRGSDEKLSMRNLVASVDKRTYSNETLQLMRIAIQAKELVAVILTATLWVSTRPDNFDVQEQWLKVDMDHNRMKALMNKVNLCSVESSMLNFCAKEYVDAKAIAQVLSFIAQTRAPMKIVAIPPHASVMPNRAPEVLQQVPELQAVTEQYSLTGSTACECVIAVIHFQDPEHWCAVFLDASKAEITMYDPLQNGERYMTIE